MLQHTVTSTILSDVLALWDFHGSLYFPNQRHLSLNLHKKVHNLLHSPLLDSFLWEETSTIWTMSSATSAERCIFATFSSSSSGKMW